MSTNMNRRRLLQAGVGAGALGLVPGMGILRDAQAAGTGKTLITLHLTGGNDTLNTVIPYADPQYALTRGRLAIPNDANLPKLDSRIALHPALGTIKSLWDRGRVAIVHGVGYPDFDYSHFQAMEIYWSADPRRTTYTGWLGRALDTATAGTASPPVLTSTSIGYGTPPALVARQYTAPQLPPNPAWFWLPSGGAHQDAMKRILSQPPTQTNLFYDAFLRNAKSAVTAYETVDAARDLRSGVDYPAGNFAKGLSFAAQLMRTDSSIRVITMEQGSYDTHDNQLPRQHKNLAELDAALKSFVADLDLNGLSDRVMILLWSEFGRRVVPNANDGTDHGSSQAMILIGTGVRRGFVGSPPSLDPATFVDRGNLPMQFDFRQLYATLLDGWIGVDSRTVLGATFGRLPVLL